MSPSDVHDRFYSVAYEAFEQCLDLDAPAPDATRNLAMTKEALTTLVCAALTDVLRARNAKKRDILSRLPVEMRTSCFRVLPLAGRVSASHVCHAWRTAAVSDRHMWSTFTASELVNLDKLETLLHRSHPVPFTFHIGQGNVHRRSLRITKSYEDAVSMLLRHAERLRSLDLHDVGRGLIDAVLSKQLPLLEQLIIACDDVSMSDLRQRTLHGRLRHLHVQRLRFREPCGSLPSVRTLTCLVTDKADMRRLLEIFPCVEQVCLLHVEERSRLPERLPPSLRSLELRNVRRDGVDYSAQIEPWFGNHHLQKLTLKNSSTMLMALRLIDEECSDSWSMQVTAKDTGRMDVSLRSKDHLRVDLTIPNFLTLAQDLRNADATMVQNLTTLAIPASALGKVLGLLLLQLPAVTHFKITILDDFELEALEDAFAAPTLMRIPHLESLVFTCGTKSRFLQWASPACQRRLPLLIAFNATRLERIILSTPHYHRFRDHDWTGFQLHANIVSVVGGSSRAPHARKS